MGEGAGQRLLGIAPFADGDPGQRPQARVLAIGGNGDAAGDRTGGGLERHAVSPACQVVDLGLEPLDAERGGTRLQGAAQPLTGCSTRSCGAGFASRKVTAGAARSAPRSSMMRRLVNGADDAARSAGQTPTARSRAIAGSIRATVRGSAWRGAGDASRITRWPPSAMRQAVARPAGPTPATTTSTSRRF